MPSEGPAPTGEPDIWYINRNWANLIVWKLVKVDRAKPFPIDGEGLEPALGLKERGWWSSSSRSDYIGRAGR